MAQSTVHVTIVPSGYAMSLDVLPDALITVPFNGAELPTAFDATMHNSGPFAITEHLAFSDIPPGFTLLSSGTDVTIPAGQTGSLGVYLQPTDQHPRAGHGGYRSPSRAATISTAPTRGR